MATTGAATAAETSSASNYGHQLGIGIVDIFVGPNRKPFRVHKDLCSKEPYFQAMFNGGFLETTEQAAKLPEDDPDAFGLFLGWLYVGRLTPMPPTDDAPKRIEVTAQHIKLYCFAEKIVSPALMDWAMTFIISICRRNDILPYFDAIKLAYENSQPKSHLRKLMARILHHIIAEDTTHADTTNEEIAKVLLKNEALAADFVRLVRASSGKGIQDPTEMRPCLFHVHADDKARESIKVFGL